jgi:hypothetical protein
MVDFDKVASVFAELLDNELLEDRREYTEQELATMYALTINEAGYLFSLISNYFATDLLALKDIDAQELLNYLRDGEHSNWDGWEERDKVLINLFVDDLKRGMFAAKRDKK